MSGSTIELRTIWNEGAKGNGTIQGDNVNIPIAIPITKGGSGEGAEPKQLLISSAIACYAMTLAYMLDVSKVPVFNFTMDTERSSNEGISHYPQVVLKEDATNEDVTKVNKMYQKAHEDCYIGQLLSKAGIPIKVLGNTTIK